MSHINRYWDTHLEHHTPDCRLNPMDRERKQVYRARSWWERLFCASCGCDGGLVTADFAAHVFYQCEECARAYGPVPGFDPMPEEVAEAHRLA